MVEITICYQGQEYRYLLPGQVKVGDLCGKFLKEHFDPVFPLYTLYDESFKKIELNVSLENLEFRRLDLELPDNAYLKRDIFYEMERRDVFRDMEDSEHTELKKQLFSGKCHILLKGSYEEDLWKFYVSDKYLNGIKNYFLNDYAEKLASDACKTYFNLPPVVLPARVLSFDEDLIAVNNIRMAEEAEEFPMSIEFSQALTRALSCDKDQPANKQFKDIEINESKQKLEIVQKIKECSVLVASVTSERVAKNTLIKELGICQSFNFYGDLVFKPLGFFSSIEFSCVADYPVDFATGVLFENRFLRVNIRPDKALLFAPIVLSLCEEKVDATAFNADLNKAIFSSLLAWKDQQMLIRHFSDYRDDDKVKLFTEIVIPFYTCHGWKVSLYTLFVDPKGLMNADGTYRKLKDLKDDSFKFVCCHHNTYDITKVEGMNACFDDALKVGIYARQKWKTHTFKVKAFAKWKDGKDRSGLSSCAQSEQSSKKRKVIGNASARSGKESVKSPLRSGSPMDESEEQECIDDLESCQSAIFSGASPFKSYDPLNFIVMSETGTSLNGSALMFDATLRADSSHVIVKVAKRNRQDWTRINEIYNAGFRFLPDHFVVILLQLIDWLDFDVT